MNDDIISAVKIAVLFIGGCLSGYYASQKHHQNKIYYDIAYDGFTQTSKYDVRIERNERIAYAKVYERNDKGKFVLVYQRLISEVNE